MGKKKKKEVPAERIALLSWIGQSHLLPGMSLSVLKDILSKNRIVDSWEDVSDRDAIRVVRAIQGNKLDSDIVPAGLGRVDSLIRRMETREMLG